MAEPSDRSSSLDNLVEDENGVFALSLTSRAMRRIPIACLIVGALGILFLLLALQLQSTEFGARLPMTIVGVQGRGASCIGCHAAQKSNDYIIFTGSLSSHM